MEEIGYKSIPSDKLKTSHVAIQFAAKGILEIKSFEEAISHLSKCDDTNHDISEQDLIGRVCIGSLLLAQGLELIFKLIFLAERWNDSGYKQHEMVKRFDRIVQIPEVLESLKRNISHKYSNTEKLIIARDVVKNTEESFMLSRYYGLRNDDFPPVSAVNSMALVFSLVFSYKGLNQTEFARLIGINIRDKNGKPINFLPAQVSTKRK